MGSLDVSQYLSRMSRGPCAVVIPLVPLWWVGCFVPLGTLFTRFDNIYHERDLIATSQDPEASLTALVTSREEAIRNALAAVNGGRSVLVTGSACMGKQTLCRRIMQRTARAWVWQRPDGRLPPISQKSAEPAFVYVNDVSNLPSTDLASICAAANAGRAIILLHAVSSHDLPTFVSDLFLDPVNIVIPLERLTQTDIAEVLRRRVPDFATAATAEAIRQITAGMPVLVNMLVSLIATGAVPAPVRVDQFTGLTSAASSALVHEWEAARIQDGLTSEEYEALQLIALTEPTPGRLLAELHVDVATRKLAAKGLLRQEIDPADPNLRICAVAAPLLALALRATLSTRARDYYFHRIYPIAIHSSDASGLHLFLEWATEANISLPAELLVTGAKQSNRLMNLELSVRLSDAVISRTLLDESTFVDDMDSHLLVANALCERASARRLMQSPRSAIGDLKYAIALLRRVSKPEKNWCDTWAYSHQLLAETYSYNFGRQETSLSELDTALDELSKIKLDTHTELAQERLKNARVTILGYAGNLSGCRQNAELLVRQGMRLDDRALAALAFSLTLLGRPLSANQLVHGRISAVDTRQRWAWEELDAAYEYTEFWAHGAAALEARGLRRMAASAASLFYRFDSVLQETLAAEFYLWQGRADLGRIHAESAWMSLPNHQTPWPAELAVATYRHAIAASGTHSPIATTEGFPTVAAPPHTLLSGLAKHQILESHVYDGTKTTRVVESALLAAQEHDKCAEWGLEALFLMVGIRCGNRDSAAQLLRIEPHLEGVYFAQVFPHYARALIDNDATGLLDVAQEASRLGAMVVARDAASEAMKAAHRHSQQSVAARARKQYGRLVSLCTGDMGTTPTQGIRRVALTAREREVQELVAEGHTSPEIADILHVSKRTVEGHRYRIGRKLGG